MQEDPSARSFDVRRKKLDELFAEQPYLSTTMKAARMHERMADSLPTLPIPVLAMTADTEMLRRMESARTNILAELATGAAVCDGLTQPEPYLHAPSSVPIVPRVSPSPLIRNVLPANLALDNAAARIQSGACSPPEVFTVEEAAAFLRVSPTFLRSMSKRQGLPCARIGRLIRYRRAALIEWLVSRES